MYTFWKLEISLNISSYFVELIRGPETHVLSPSVLSCGTHPHSIYSEPIATFPFFLQLFIRGKGSSSPRVSLPFFLFLHLQIHTKLLLMVKWMSSSSSSPWKLSIDAIFDANHPFQGSLWASLVYLKHFQVSSPPKLLDLCSSSLREAPSSLLGALSSYFLGLTILGFVMGYFWGFLHRLLIWAWSGD